MSPQVGSIPLIYLGGWAGYCASPNQISIVDRATRATTEIAADRLAFSTLDKTGYDPRALLSYISRTDQSRERAGALTNLTPQLPLRTYIESSSQFDQTRLQPLNLR